MLTFDQLIQAWDQFFHGPESVSVLAVFRILWGGLLFLNGALMFKDQPILLGPSGYVPYDVYQKNRKPRFCLFDWLPATMFSVWLVWSIYMLAALFLTIGLFTRTSALLIFLTTISMHHRNGFIWSGGDNLQRILTFLLIFSPAGESLSLDAYLAGEPIYNPDHLIDPWAWRLMQIQISVLYLRTIFWKLKGPQWRSGTAVWYTLQTEELCRLKVPRILTNTKLTTLITWNVLATQLALGAGVWIDELVYPVLFAGILMHLGLDIVLNLQLFSWTMIASYLLFVRPDDLNFLLIRSGLV